MLNTPQVIEAHFAGFGLPSEELNFTKEHTMENSIELLKTQGKYPVSLMQPKLVKCVCTFSMQGKKENLKHLRKNQTKGGKS